MWIFRTWYSFILATMPSAEMIRKEQKKYEQRFRKHTIRIWGSINFFDGIKILFTEWSTREFGSHALPDELGADFYLNNLWHIKLKCAANFKLIGFWAHVLWMLDLASRCFGFNCSTFTCAHHWARTNFVYVFAYQMMLDPSRNWFKSGFVQQFGCFRIVFPIISLR